MIKRIFCLCAALIFATGCTGGTAEVRERIYVQSAVLDAGEYTSLELFLFEGTGELVEGVGKDIFSATENAAVRTGREIFLGHTELLCLKSPMDSSGLMNCLDEYRLSPGCRLLLLQGEDISEDTDTTKLTDSLKLGTEKGNIPQTDLFTILKELQSADGKALAPLLTEDGISMCITDGQNILGILSQRATIGLVWLRGDNHPERITVTGENGTESFQVYSACTDVSAQIIKGIPHIKAEVKKAVHFLVQYHF